MKREEQRRLCGVQTISTYEDSCLPAYECPKAWETGVLIECVAPNARKVALWSVLFGNGKLDKVWSSDMQVISESR